MAHHAQNGANRQFRADVSEEPCEDQSAMKTKVMPDSRISLPASLRKKHGLVGGGDVIVEDAGDAIVFRTLDQVVARAGPQPRADPGQGRCFGRGLPCRSRARGGERMTAVVLDASALLALLLNEASAGKGEGGLERRAARHRELRRGGEPLREVRRQPGRDRCPATANADPADPALSFEAGLLRPLTIKGGLSLGDRYCLALAKRENVAAMTAERRWPDIAKSAGVRVELIR